MTGEDQIAMIGTPAGRFFGPGRAGAASRSARRRRASCSSSRREQGVVTGQDAGRLVCVARIEPVQGRIEIG